MFSLKNKLDLNLKNALKNNLYKNYRVLIHCKSLQNKVERKLKSYNSTVIRSIPSIRCICAIVSQNIIERLIEYPEVDHIILDSYAFLCGSSVLGANGVTYDISSKLTGKGITIGIVDSGVYPHADLRKPSSKVLKFLDLINNLNYPYDDNGHGTFISGIISSSGFSSNGMYRGIAQNSKLYMVKAFNSMGRGFISDILFGIDTLINESDDNNIKIICLPFEITDYNEFNLSLFSKLFDRAIEKNIIVVVPSGHNGNDENSMRGIALLKNCLTVGGIDTSSGKKPYKGSSSGMIGKIEKPDLSAACVNICSLNSDVNYVSEKNGQKLYPHPLDKLYATYTGTSCAAAYISGICALLYEKNPDLTYSDIVSMLKISCNFLNIPKSLQGAGIIDIKKLFS